MHKVRVQRAHHRNGESSIARNGPCLVIAGTTAIGLIVSAVAYSKPPIPTISVPCRATIKHGSYVRAVVAGTRTDIVVSGDADGEIRVSNLATGESNLLFKTGGLSSLALSSDERLVAANGGEGLMVFDMNAKRLVLSVEIPSCFTGVAFSPSNHLVAVGTEDGIVVEDVRKRRRRSTLLASDLGAGHVGCVAFLDDARLVAGYSDGRLAIWEVDGRKEAAILIEGPSISRSQGVFSLSVSTDVKLVATGKYFDEDAVQVWRLKDRKLMYSNHDLEATKSVAFSPDSALIAATRDHNVILLDRQGGMRELKTGHSDDAWTVAFSRTGRYLVTGSQDRTVCVWDVKGLSQPKEKADENW